MIGKRLNCKGANEPQGATVLGPADFPLGSFQSRAAARLRLRQKLATGELAPNCICFPENEPPFFCSESEEEIAAKVKCPLHGNRFKPTTFHIFVANWRREREKIRRQRLSPQYRKAWLASFPGDSWPVVAPVKDGAAATESRRSE
jgi:hypothetical protein